MTFGPSATAGGPRPAPPPPPLARRAPRGGVRHVARNGLRAEPLDHRAARRAHQRPHRLPPGAERLDDVTADEAAPARDQHRHAGPTNGVAKGRSTTRASRPAARTITPDPTSRRIRASPIQRPPPATPLSGTQARLVTRPTSRSRWVTLLHPSAGVAGGSASNSRPRR